MSLHNHVSRHSRLALQAINILREQLQQQSLFVQQLDERVRYRGPEFARIKLMRECVERFRVVSEVGDIEDGFSIGEIEAREIGIEACIWRSEVWYSGRCAYTRTCLDCFSKL
jgi:hypothetical protein